MPEEHMYQLVDRDDCPGPDFLRLLMERTGSGSKISVRQLAAAVGVSHSTIGKLLTGQTRQLPYEHAHRVAQRIGVDMDVLWVAVGRSARSIRQQRGRFRAIDHHREEVPA